MPDSVVFRPPWVRAGFHADVRPGAGSGLLHAGEQWAPARFRIAPHTHPVWEFYLQVHGESSWAAGGEAFTLGPGHLLGVAPGVAHHMRRESSRYNHFFFAALDPGPACGRHPSLAADWRELPAIVHRADAGEVGDAFRQLCRELTTTRRHAPTGLALAVDRLVLDLTRRLRDGRPAPVLAGHPAVAAARELLDRDSARRWTLEELAGAVGLASGHLAAVFAREVGVPPHRYLTEQRVRQARHLLGTGELSVTAVGLAVGFGSGQHFARVFRQVTGESPREYRRRGTESAGPRCRPGPAGRS